MSKILKNQTADAVLVSDTGYSVPGSGQLTIDPTQYNLFAASSDVIALVGDGTLVVNDGSVDLSISDGIDLIKGGLPGLRDSNNALMTRPKFAEAGWTYQARFMGFSTSLDDSIVNDKDDGTAFSDATLKFYDDEGTEITGPGAYASKQEHLDNECVETRFQWNPAYDHEIVGGEIYFTVPGSDVILWCIGAPGMGAYGGHKIMVSGCNLKMIAAGKLRIDGRTSKRMNYNAGAPNANAIRFTFKHNAGVQVACLLSLEHYKS